MGQVGEGGKELKEQGGEGGIEVKGPERRNK